MWARKTQKHSGSLRAILGLPLCTVALCCAVAPRSEVSPEEIPTLETLLLDSPDNGDLVLRYAAALFTAERCDSASVVAMRGSELEPSNVIGPLVIGQCHEQSGNYDDALQLYRNFIDDHGNAPGTAAVRGRELIARRGRAVQLAQEAVANEAAISAEPGDARTVAILPVVISGDPQYQALSRGLAQMMVSDLDLIQQFRLVERLQLWAILDELALAQTGRVDPATTARLGRLTRAGRVVQGTASLPPDGAVLLEATVVRDDGSAVGSDDVGGDFRDLLTLEKELVIEVAARLGYVLSQAERALVMENGTRNIVAFLAYSDGLVELDAGNFATAAQHFSRAVTADPNFAAAQDEQANASVAEVVSAASPGQVTTVGASAQAAASPQPQTSAAAAALFSGVSDVAGTQSEQVTESSGNQNAVSNQAARSPIADIPPGAAAASELTLRIRIKIR